MVLFRQKRTNTDKIVAALGNGNYAAKLCSDLVLNGFSDWYLPSIEELNQLRINKNVIGGFQGVVHASSTEVNQTTVYTYDFTQDVPISIPKGAQLVVRAIRYF